MRKLYKNAKSDSVSFDGVGEMALLGATRIMMFLYLYFRLPHATQEDIRLRLMGYLWLKHTSLTVTVTEHDYNCVCHLKIIS